MNGKIPFIRRGILWILVALVFSGAVHAEFTAPELNLAWHPDPITDRAFWDTPVAEFLKNNKYFYRESETALGTILRCRIPFVWLDRPIAEVRIYCRENKPYKVLASFYNKGDSDMLPSESQKNLQVGLKDKLNELLSVKPQMVSEKISIRLKSQYQRWSGQASVVALKVKTDEFCNLEITDRRVGGGLLEDAIQQSREATGILHEINAGDFLLNVNYDSDGSVWIANIPMIDQGDKGYCTVATFERVLRYYGVEVDQHVVADVAQTFEGGGTLVSNMLPALKRLSHGNDLKAGMVGRDPESSLKMERIQSLIDQGVPIIWNVDLAKTKEEGIRAAAGDGGHTRLIIGYNALSQTIIFSDSWGPEHAKKIMPLELAEKIHMSALYVQP